MNLKLGKTPATPPKLKLASYIKPSQLPAAPANFGWDYLVEPNSWGILGNDQYGDCVWAGAAHEHMLWAKSGKSSVVFDEAGVLSAYHDVTGFDPHNPDSDQGTNVQAAAQYRQQTGIPDAAGNRHKIGAWVALEPGNLDQLASAAWIFGSVGIGIEVPAYLFDQFQNGRPWDIARRNTAIEGGHYICVVGRKDYYWHVVTWGKTQPMTGRLIRKICDEAYVYLSTEELANGVNLDGFNLAALQDDIAQLAKGNGGLPESVDLPESA